MHSSHIRDLLRQHNLRDTQPRRMVIMALQHGKRAISASALQKRIAAKGEAINVVTVYRVLAVLESLHIVHRHPCNGRYSLCSIPERRGHHGFLHCTSCGRVEEFCDADLCRMEDRIARASRFRPTAHVSEIVGECHSCLPS